VGYAEEVPLPADVSKLDEPYEINMGSQPIQVQAFSTQLSAEQLRTFYEAALPKHGWRINLPPWMAQVQKQQEAVKQVVQQHPELEQDPAFARQTAGLNSGKLGEFMRQQIYAARGTERLLLNITPQEGHRNLVFVNRWQAPSGDSQASLPVGPMPAAKAPEETGWPAVNPCCSGESVPTALRTLPNSIPQYPNARMVSTGAAPPSEAGRAAMSEMYRTEDSVDQVVEYYRKHLAYNGWSEMEGMSAPPLDQVLGPQAAQVNARMLSFRNDRGMCGVAIVENPAAATASGLAGSQGPTGQRANGPTERTVILVTYFESPFLSKSPRHGTPTEGPQGMNR